MDKPLIEVEVKITQDFVESTFKLFMKVIRYEYIQSEIFVFNKNLDGTTSFTNVANATQLMDLPLHSPIPGQIYYLENCLELIFNSAAKVLEYESLIKDSIVRLLNDWYLVKDKINKTETTILQPDI